jgi:hypothetical protein
MLSLNGVGNKNHVWFMGVDIRQCPMHGHIIFENETAIQVAVAFTKDGISGTKFDLAPYETNTIENLDGEQHLMVVHMPTDSLELLYISMTKDGNTTSKYFHRAVLTITKIDRQSPEVG